jgi:conjugative transfer signal peptidase TraF
MPQRINRSTLVLGVCVLVAVVSTRWVRLNVSGSVPYGLYRLSAVPSALTPGMLVVLPVPASVQPWHSRWLPLLKPVAATAGQDVCVQEDTLWIGGQSYGPVRHEAHGRRVPHIEGCATVEPGMVFLASHAPASLDGRYFGSTPVSTLTARALPVLTWEARPPCRKFEGSLGVSR